MLIACLAKICYTFPPLHRDDQNISTVDRESRMRKVEIVNRIAEETRVTKVKAEEAVDAILEEVK